MDNNDGGLVSLSLSTPMPVLLNTTTTIIFVYTLLNVVQKIASSIFVVVVFEREPRPLKTDVRVFRGVVTTLYPSFIDELTSGRIMWL